MPTVPEIITESILKQLEQGVAPWRKPWSTSVPRNLISKKPYRGLNVFMLATQGYDSPYWLTFSQTVRRTRPSRREKHCRFVWKFNEYARENRETGETENKTSVLLRTCFSHEQCEGLKHLRRRPESNQSHRSVRIYRQSDAKCPANRATFASVLSFICGYGRNAVSQLL
jgi:antirestriction protein ArdC